MSATEYIFVSYARRDTKQVDRIVGALRAAGYRVWIDRDGILSGRLWGKEIVAAIQDSKAFVIALTPYAVASPNVQKELILGDQYGKRVVPLLLAETIIPNEMQYPLAGVQYVAWHSFEEGFEELCRTLKGFNIECLDPTMAADIPPKPVSSWWRDVPGVFGVAAVLAAILIAAAARLTQGKTAIPSSLTSLMPVSLFESGRAGLLSLGLLGVLAILAIVFGYAKSLRSAIVRLAPFLLLPVPLAVWKGQYVAAASGLITAAAVGAWWSRRSTEPKSGAARASIVAPALILLGSVVLGVTMQYLLARDRGSGSIIGMTPFEVVGDEGLENKQADLSEKLLQKVSAVFSKGGLNVVPRSFKRETLNDWTIDNWRLEKAKQFEPWLLLETSLRQCGARTYSWFVQPYGRDVEPMANFAPASASGSDPRVLSLRIAFNLLTAARDSIALTQKQRNQAMRVIVLDALNVANNSNGDMATQIASATSLLAQPAIDSKKVDELLDGLAAADTTCDDEAERNRDAQKANASSYGEGGP